MSLQQELQTKLQQTGDFLTITRANEWALSPFEFLVKEKQNLQYH